MSDRVASDLQPFGGSNLPETVLEYPCSDQRSTRSDAEEPPDPQGAFSRRRFSL